MVTFEKDRYVIIVKTGYNPVENWQMLHDSLCDIIRSVKSESINDESFYAAVDFIRELMPDWEAAKKMTE